MCLRGLKLTELEIRPLKPIPEVFEQVAAFLRNSFQGVKNIMTPAYLEWCYQRNPDGTAIAFSAYEGEEVVAHFASTPMFTRVFGREEMGLLIHHGATLPRCAGQGIFKTLVNRVMQVGAERGFSFAIGVPNANSAFPLVHRLGFDHVGHLDVRLGFGSTAKSRQDQESDLFRIWTPEALAWRLSRPDMPYRIRREGAWTLVYADSGILGIPVELGTYPTEKIPSFVDELSTRNPVRVWIGLDPSRHWGFRPYVNVPVRFRPAPLNVTILDLSGSGRKFRDDRISVDGLDFDAY